MNEHLGKLRPKLTEDFLATLIEARELIKKSGEYRCNWCEVHAFIQACFTVSGRRYKRKIVKKNRPGRPLKVKG